MVLSLGVKRLTMALLQNPSERTPHEPRICVLMYRGKRTNRLKEYS